MSRHGNGKANGRHRGPAPAAVAAPPLRVCVGVSAGRVYDFEAMHCLFRLLRFPNLLYLPRGNDALIERSRSWIATYFLEQTDAPVLVTFDTDIVFEPEDVLTIARQAHDLQAIVGGVYVTRNRQRCIPTSFFHADQPIEFAGDPTPRLVRWLATGFMAVPRVVFQTLATQPDMPVCHPDEPTLRLRPFYLPFVVDDDVGRPIFLSEDWALCERAAQHGIKCYVNPAVRLIHLGEHGFRLEDMAQPPLPTTPVVITRIGGADARYRIDTPTLSVTEWDAAGEAPATHPATGTETETETETETDGAAAPQEATRAGTR